MEKVNPRKKQNNSPNKHLFVLSFTVLRVSLGFSSHRWRQRAFSYGKRNMGERVSFELAVDPITRNWCAFPFALAFGVKRGGL